MAFIKKNLVTLTIVACLVCSQLFVVFCAEGGETTDKKTVKSNAQIPAMMEPIKAPALTDEINAKASEKDDKKSESVIKPTVYQPVRSAEPSKSVSPPVAKKDSAGDTASKSNVISEKTKQAPGTVVPIVPSNSQKSGIPALAEQGLKTQSGSLSPKGAEIQKTEKKTTIETPAKSSDGAVAAQKAKDVKYVAIDFDNVDMRVFIKFISELTGKNFVVDDKVKGKATILSPRKISIDEAYKVFQSVLEVHGYTTVQAGDVIKIIPSQEAKEKNVETRLEEEAIDPEDKVVTQIISLENANSDDMKKLLDPMVSKASVVLSYPPTGMLVITDVLSNIKRLQSIISAVDVEGVGEQISFIPVKRSSSVEIVKILAAVFQQQKGAPKFVADVRSNAVIMISSEAYSERVKQLISFMDKEVPRAGDNLHVYRLQHAIAEDLAKVLMNLSKSVADAQKGGKAPLLSKDIQVVPDKATNMLIITADKDDYQVLEGVIKKVDVPRPMVYIEALIMEVAVTKDFKLGVEWRAIRETGRIPGSDSGTSAVFAGSGGLAKDGGYKLFADSASTSFTFPGGFSVGVLGTGITIGGIVFPNIGAVLQAVKRDSDISILSTPQIMTTDNEEAEINVGKNVPYITRQEKSVTGIDYSNYEYKDVGVMLNVTPHISAEDYVRLKISQQVTQVIKEESTTGLPTTLKRTAKTTVVIKDKETIVIGGLVGDSTEVTTSKVPLLGDIPILGWLFKSLSRSREKTNLYVFLTPRIIRNQTDLSAVTRDKKNAIGEIEEGVIKMKDKNGSKKESKQNSEAH